jgi:hypothetical protein
MHILREIIIIQLAVALLVNSNKHLVVEIKFQTAEAA